MANETYIYRLRTDLGSGAFQITDLTPNSSRKTAVLKGQSGYLPAYRAAPTAVVTAAVGGNDVTSAAYTGLSAYLLDHVEQGGLAAGTSALTDANALLCANAIVAIADAGTALTLTLVNAALAGVVVSTELTSAGGSASTGSLSAVLKILCGATYTLPAASITETPTGTFNPSESGALTSPEYRQLYMSGTFAMSLAEGDLATWTDAAFTYAMATGAPAVVYGEAGAVIS
jgi:hypothetical protein